MSSGKKSGLAQCRSLLHKVINQRASVKKIEITFLFLEFSHGKIYRKRAFDPMTEINCQHIAFLLYHSHVLYWWDYRALAISHTHTRRERERC